MAYKKNYNKEEYAKEKAQEVKDLVDKIENGVKGFMTSDKFKDYLNVMSKFHKYSFSNSLLIAFQRPDSTIVAGYTTWKKMGRQVNKGAKSIKILAPSPYKKKVETEVINSKTGKKEKAEEEVTKMCFKAVSVFDISDTVGKELPKLCDELKGESKYLDIVKDVTKELTGIEVVYEDIKNGAKGYFALKENKIAIKNGLSKLHEEKTIIHELSHALLHSNMKKDGITRSAAETQAEAIAYVVCQRFGLDTGDYSFPYLTSWANSAELVDLKNSLKVIQQTSMLIIDKIEEKLKVLEIDKEIKINDEKLVKFLGKNKVIINEIDKNELEDLINKNESSVFLKNDKELTIKNEVVAMKIRGKYRDVYIGTSYELDKLIYIDDNKNLYKIKDCNDLNKDKSIKELISDAEKTSNRVNTVNHVNRKEEAR